MPELIVINQRGLTKLVPLPQGRTTIGRDALNAIVIDCQSVSRHHAVLTRDDAIVMLHDLGSRNGTRVNDVKVAARQLRHGDTLAIGDWLLRFLDRTAAAARPHDPLDQASMNGGLQSLYGAPQPALPGWDAQV